MTDKKPKPKGKHGGARVGAGRRPVNGQNLIDREKAIVAGYEREAALIPNAAPGRRRKLCKEIMADRANTFFDLAEQYMPTFNPDGSIKDAGDFQKFVQFSVLAVEAASKGAPYESPRLQAIAMVTEPPGSRAAQLGEMTPRERISKVFTDIQKRLQPSLPPPTPAAQGG